jgi:hypothetical protein
MIGDGNFSDETLIVVTAQPTADDPPHGDLAERLWLLRSDPVWRSYSPLGCLTRSLAQRSLRQSILPVWLHLHSKLCLNRYVR